MRGDRVWVATITDGGVEELMFPGSFNDVRSVGLTLSADLLGALLETSELVDVGFG